MLFFFNIRGLIIVFAAISIGELVQGLTTGIWETDAGIGLLIAGPLTLAVDLLYRTSQYPEEGNWRFLKPTTGGQLMFIPVWLFGLVWIFVGIHALVTDRGGQVVAHERFMNSTVALLEETAEHLENIDTRAAWEATQPRLERCRQRLRELGPFYRSLSDNDRRRLERKYGQRITRAADGLWIQAARLNVLPEPRRPHGEAAQE